MSSSVRKILPTPLELQYEELKKQSVLDRENQARHSRKERQQRGIMDEVTLSSAQSVIADPSRRKPSQPVTTDEMQALRTQLSVYV